MKARRYRSETMADALAQVKRELGRDAVILETRRCRIGGIWGVGGRRAWEITAAGSDAPVQSPTGRYQSDVPSAAPDQAGGERDLRTQLSEIHGLVRRMAATSGPAGPSVHPPHVRNVHDYLTEHEVDASLAADLAAELATSLDADHLADAECVRRALIERLAARIRTAEPAGVAPRVMMFVGPTGVGKTTTIAKLAANLKLHQRARVAMVTIDTYRIGAVEQLRTYADIIDVPLRAVLSPGELHQAVHGWANADAILVDTTGRSPSDATRLGQLRSFIDAAEPDETHLVVSATSGPAAVRRVVEQFHPLGAERAIVTKLDEAVSLGHLVNVPATLGLPLSYTTCGQEVPDDIDQACPDRLAEMITRDLRG